MGFLLRTGTNVAFLIFTSERDAVAGFSPNEAFEPSARIATAA
jgi:hypothetical protein